MTSLRARGSVTLRPSPTNRSEKIVALTPRAQAYLTAHRKAVKRIERELRTELGEDSYAALIHAIDVLGGQDQPRMRDYLRNKDSSTSPHRMA